MFLQHIPEQCRFLFLHRVTSYIVYIVASCTFRHCGGLFMLVQCTLCCHKERNFRHYWIIWFRLINLSMNASFPVTSTLSSLAPPAPTTDVIYPTPDSSCSWWPTRRWPTGPVARWLTWRRSRRCAAPSIRRTPWSWWRACWPPTSSRRHPTNCAPPSSDCGGKPAETVY